MSDQWHYIRAGGQYGPVSFSELSRLASSGQLAPTDLVWGAGAPDWIAAQTVPGLSFPREVEVLPPVARAQSQNSENIVLLHLKRAFAWNLDELTVTRDEAHVLNQEGITHARAHRYLCWRRSLLWVIVLPTFLAAVLYSISQFSNTEIFTGFGILVLILDVLAHFALPAAVFVGAYFWMRPRLSIRLVFWAWIVAFLYPMFMALLPLDWLVDLSEMQQAAGGRFAREVVGIFIGFAYYVSLMPTVLSVIPGILRACLRVKTLLPESVLSGWFLIGTTPLYGLIFLVTFIMVNQMIGNLILLLGMFLLLGAPMIYLTRPTLFTRPITSPQQKGRINRLQQAQLIGLGCGMIFLLIYLFTKEILEKSLVGFSQETSWVPIWNVLRFGVEYLGRSLFITVVVAHLLLRATIMAEQSEQELQAVREGSDYQEAMESLAGQLKLSEGEAKVLEPQVIGQ